MEAYEKLLNSIWGKLEDISIALAKFETAITVLANDVARLQEEVKTNKVDKDKFTWELSKKFAAKWVENVMWLMLSTGILSVIWAILKIVLK